MRTLTVWCMQCAQRVHPSILFEPLMSIVIFLLIVFSYASLFGKQIYKWSTGLVTLISLWKVENVRLLDRSSGQRKASFGTLYLSATHTIFVENNPETRKETWVSWMLLTTNTSIKKQWMKRLVGLLYPRSWSNGGSCLLIGQCHCSNVQES